MLHRQVTLHALEAWILSSTDSLFNRFSQWWGGSRQTSAEPPITMYSNEPLTDAPLTQATASATQRAAPVAKDTSPSPIQQEVAPLFASNPHRLTSFIMIQGKPSIFPEMGELWRDQNEKWIVTGKMTPLLTKRKTKISIFELFLYIHTQGDLQSKKIFNLSWIRVKFFYNIFNNLSGLLNGDLAAKIGREILPYDLMHGEYIFFLQYKVNIKYVYKG